MIDKFSCFKVLAVLEHTEQIQNRNAVEFDSDSRVMKNSSAIEQSSPQEASATNVQINTQHARGTHLLQLSAQAIFSALDHTTRWLRQTESTNLDGRSKHVRYVAFTVAHLAYINIIFSLFFMCFNKDHFSNKC